MPAVTGAVLLEQNSVGADRAVTAGSVLLGQAPRTVAISRYVSRNRSQFSRDRSAPAGTEFGPGTVAIAPRHNDRAAT